MKQISNSHLRWPKGRRSCVKYISKERINKSYDVTSLCCKAFKRSCLELEKDYSLFSNLNYGEDTLQSVEVYSNAQNIVYLNECLYNYRVIPFCTL